ncbi:MAG TPA: VOC family protein [Actinomycetota bacterium]|nr:VOC family protein [Actinomycetota bacterium]
MRSVARRIDHVNVTTPEELERDMVAWYEEVLGLTRIAKPPGTRPLGAWFSCGNAQVHVSVDPHNPPKTAHFGVVVDDFTGAIERLRSAGCHLEQAREMPGRKRCYVRDPAGNRIEILAFEDAPAPADEEEI